MKYRRDLEDDIARVDALWRVSVAVGAVAAAAQSIMASDYTRPPGDVMSQEEVYDLLVCSQKWNTQHMIGRLLEEDVLWWAWTPGMWGVYLARFPLEDLFQRVVQKFLPP